MQLEKRGRTIFASHYQFYIEDPDFPVDTSAPDFWTETASNNRLAVGPGVLGIRTGSYGFVRLLTEAHDSPPEYLSGTWDHIIEAGLVITQGKLKLVGCLDDGNEEIFSVPPGHYRVRCYYSNLAESVDVGEGGDWYVVQFWPGGPDEIKILERWDEA